MLPNMLNTVWYVHVSVNLLYCLCLCMYILLCSSDNCLVINASQYAEILEGGFIAPFNFIKVQSIVQLLLPCA